ncbi:MAG: hypothetical protein EAZ43_04255 [Betaproteobacteria bacterium]|nr:MAG: hypothetical protein EAZ43_04255 [Betaproteobacteria bacterium]
MTSLDTIRHTQQFALKHSKVSLRFGQLGLSQLTPALRQAADDETHATWNDGGLTARVRRFDAEPGSVAIKKARPECLVKNRDGELSFINELLRRQELEQLRERDHAIAGLIPTLYASLEEQVVVSPWINGSNVQSWNERQLAQVFSTGIALIAAGFFEWDFSPGNILDDGANVWLFDFGYMYRFDPLRQFNSAGDGTEHPHFHLAERIESRNFFGHLLQREHESGVAAVMPLCKLEKEIALDAYQRLIAALRKRGAIETVISHYERICERWQTALKGDMSSLYLKEAWRSHDADLDDDIRGQTCTPMTLRKAEWMIERVRSDFSALVEADALHSDDKTRGREVLLEALQLRLQSASAFQIHH